MQGSLKPAYGLRREVSARLRDFFGDQGGSDAQWDDDKEFIKWTEQNYAALAAFSASCEKEASATCVSKCMESVLKSAAGSSSEAIADVFRSSLEKLSAEERERAIAALKLV
jgi:hypothetical protein